MAKVREFMTPDVVTIERQAPVREAARLMKEHDIGLLPVVEDGELCGVVTDRDLVVRAMASDGGASTVGDILTKDLVCLKPDDDEKDAEKLMSENDVRRLPVVDRGRLVGMVSVGDLAVRSNDKLAGKVMEQTGPED